MAKKKAKKMQKNNSGHSEKFNELVSSITQIGQSWHANSLVENPKLNKPHVGKSLKELPAIENEDKKKSCIVISAGPSLHKFDLLKLIKETNYKGTLVAVDGSYHKCLKAGITPDYVLSLDPHPTRIVRWFGDPDFEKNTEGDDYFSRQDLDVDFRNNTIKENLKNIELINKNAKNTKLLLCTTAPENVTARTKEAGFDTYWWNPIVDNPREEGSLTKEIYNSNKLPCMNTGGTVGTAAWVFATTILKIPSVAVIGMDLGYHAETPLSMTQTYYELGEFVDKDSENFKELFPKFTFPLTGVEYYSDPTYFWYRKNMLELLERAPGRTYNCSQGGTLFSEKIECMYLKDFISNH